MTDKLTSPILIRPVETQQVRHNRIFRFVVENSFLPRNKKNKKDPNAKENDELEDPTMFELIHAPPWMQMGKRSGMVTGFAPKVHRDTRFLVTIRVFNSLGSLNHSFFVNVICTDIADVYANRLMNQYDLKKRLRTFGDQHPHQHSILEYLYEYIMNSEDQHRFVDHMVDYANKLHLEIIAEPRFEDFKKVALALDSQIEEKIQHQLANDFILTNLELSNVDFHRLFMQGSQPLGCYAIPVWNYLARPEEHNWSGVWNVLNAAALLVMEQKKRDLTPKLKPDHH